MGAMLEIDWTKKNICLIANEMIDIEETCDPQKLRKKIEPWLTAVFQSEHLSLLIGSGLPLALNAMIPSSSQKKIQGMGRITFSKKYSFITEFAEESAKQLDRGSANFEDDIRVANDLLKGYQIQKSENGDELKRELNTALSTFASNILKNEKELMESSQFPMILNTLRQFLISFASRTATRDRLHIFTTNYDRFIEYALDESGIFVLDRFIGTINPKMHLNKYEVDLHYNPPGIRGEPRYIEGVVRYTKIHGSLDWIEENGEIIKAPFKFGSMHSFDGPCDSLIIYPNSSKGIETDFFPYSELFRDFSSALCRPNSVLVTYGYGFGDSHINRIILDMMSILSTHVVIISYDDAGGRIEKFVNKCNISQITLLIGKKLGNIENLVKYYLPKAAIDTISCRRTSILERRGVAEKNDDSEETV